MEAKSDSLDLLICNYAAIQRHPILSLYISDYAKFIDTYLVIEDSDYIFICNRDTLSSINIDKNDPYFQIDIKEIITNKNLPKELNYLH